MRVLLLTNSYPTPVRPYRGVFFREQANSVQSEGFQVDIISPNLYSIKDRTRPSDRKLQVLEEDGKRVYLKGAVNYGSRTNFYQSKKYVSIARKLYKKYISDHGKPDFIHAHVGLWAGWAAYLISKEFDVPYIITEHSSEVLSGKVSNSRIPKFKALYSNATKVLAVSQPLADKIRSEFNIEEVLIVPNVVDTDKFHLSDSEPKNTILSIGTLNKNKRFDLLIHAFAKIRTAFPDYELAIIGDGPEKENLQQIINSKNLGDSIKLIGRVEHDKLQNWYSRAKLFCLCSEFETFGVVVIEAMSAGVPCVVTPSGGPDQIVNPDNGIVCQDWDVDSVSSAIREVLEREDLFDRFNIREGIIKNYSRKAVGDQLRRIYEVTFQ